MQRGAGGRDLGQPALDRGMDVLICRTKPERALVELPLDPPKSALDRRRLRLGHKTCRRKASRMREAARDVVRIELVIHLERGGKPFELGQHRPAEAPAPELLTRRFAGYGASLFTSPNKLPRSLSWSRPWTSAEVRTPKPQSLMKP